MKQSDKNELIDFLILLSPIWCIAVCGLIALAVFKLF